VKVRFFQQDLAKPEQIIIEPETKFEQSFLEHHLSKNSLLPAKCAFVYYAYIDGMCLEKTEVIKGPKGNWNEVTSSISIELIEAQKKIEELEIELDLLKQRKP